MIDKPKKNSSFLLVLLIASMIISTLFSGFAKNMAERNENKPSYFNSSTQHKK